MAYTQEDKYDFIGKLYCAARQVAIETGCSWELILAQAAQETGWGEKVLPGTNNIFNIKADPGWQGESKVFHVHEFKNGRKIWMDSPFRVYPDVVASLRDRVAFLRKNPRYAAHGLYDEDVKGNLRKEARALQSAGYATDPRYADALAEVFAGKTMQRAIARAQKAGCSAILPMIEVFFKNGAKAAIAGAKVNITLGSRTMETRTGTGGGIVVKVPPNATGTLQLKIFDEHKNAWIAVDPVAIPNPVRSITVTLVAPTFTVATSTRVHDKPAAPARPAGPPPQPAKPGAAGTKTYTVVKGDTLVEIAEKCETRYKTIAELNHIKSPYIIRPGQVLRVPDHGAAGQAAQVPAPAPGAAQAASARDTEVHALYYRDKADKPKTDVVPAIRAPWMKHAEDEFKAKVRRVPGPGNNQHILNYFTATRFNGHKPATKDETAWCAAFCNWCLTKAGFKGNDSAWAADFKKWGRPTKDNKPAFGAVALIRFESGAHHVTFVAGLSKDGRRLATLGGNQGDNHGVTHGHVNVRAVVCYRYPSDYVDSPEDYVLHDLKSDSGDLTAASTR